MYRCLVILLFVALAACSETNSQVDGSSPSDAGIDPMDNIEADAAQSQVDAGWSASGEFGPCVAPDDLAEDPLSVVQEVALEGRTVHVLDTEVDPSNGRIYVGGAGGLFVIENDGGDLEVVGASSAGGGRGGKFDRLEAIGEGLLLTTERNRGLTVYDASNPAQIQQMSTLNELDLSGAGWSAPYAYIAVHTGSLLTVDLTERSNPRIVNRMGGLGNPWEVVVVGQRLYVADNRLGLVVVDITNPVAPVLGSATQAAGSAQDLWVDGAYLYLATGAAGVEIFSLAEPDAPESVALVGFGASIVSVSVDADVLWATNHEDVVAVDVSEPTNPRPLAMEKTEQWAMHVVAHEGLAYVADWGQLVAYELDATVRAPEADLSRHDVYMGDGVNQARISVWNMGGDELSLRGVEIDDPRFMVTVSTDEVAMGHQATIALEFLDDGEPIDTELCLATNDPDEPIQRVRIRSTSGVASVALGEAAPDFVLRDLDGNPHQLSLQLGQPVVLCYFATW